MFFSNVWSCADLTDESLDPGHQAAGRRRQRLLREITGVQDVVHCGAVFTVVQELIVFGVL